MLTDVLVRYRWLFVVPVVLPLSVLFDLYWAIRNWYYRGLKSAPEGHTERVRDIQAQVRQWRAAGGRQPLCTARKEDRQHERPPAAVTRCLAPVTVT